MILLNSIYRDVSFNCDFKGAFMANGHHLPVMVEEVIEGLRCEGKKTYIDGTVGCGGHALEILKRTGPLGKVIGVDCDEEALEVARERLEDYKGRVIMIHDNFSNLRGILKRLGITSVDAILLDLGLSSLQLERNQRGFSFSKDGPLDMRMDRRAEESAFHLVNNLPEKDLRDILLIYGEERWAQRITRRIVKRREVDPIKTTGELADIVVSSIPGKYQSKRIHPATKTFQAIRIAVNKELQNLKKSLNEGVDLLKEGGRFVVISYHSLEDRIVKSSFKTFEKGCICPPSFPQCVCGLVPKLRVITKRPIRPSEEEVTLNPRSRSAKLRIAERKSLFNVSKETLNIIENYKMKNAN